MTLKEWLETCISFLRVIISWPLLAFIFIVLFRSQIATLILGIRKFGREGVEVAPPSDRSMVTGATSVTISPITPEEESMQVVDPPVLRDYDERIRADIRAKGLEGSPNLVKILVRQLAVTQLSLYSEVIYSQIWGSQIATLSYLNPRAEGVQVSDVRRIYDTAARNSPQAFAAYPFDNFLKFLESWSLVKREGDRITITSAGREFLAYIPRTGKSMDKPY